MTAAKDLSVGDCFVGKCSWLFRVLAVTKNKSVKLKLDKMETGETVFRVMEPDEKVSTFDPVVI